MLEDGALRCEAAVEQSRILGARGHIRPTSNLQLMIRTLAVYSKTEGVGCEHRLCGNRTRSREYVSFVTDASERNCFVVHMAVIWAHTRLRPKTGSPGWRKRRGATLVQ